MSFEAQLKEDLDDSVLSGKPFFSRPAGKIFIIWLVFTAIGVLIGFYVPHHIMPTMLSTEGTDAFKTVVLFTVLAAPVAAFTFAVPVYSLFAWRPKGSGSMDEPPPDGVPMRGNGPMTILWLTISFVLVIVLLVWGLGIYNAQQYAHPDTLQVDVTGQQWLWTFSYPGTNVESRSLVLPVNRPVEFNVTSVDVTHGFWPAALGVQVDANPNEITVIRSTPDKLGSFEVRCSQLCGLYHAFMYASGAVVTPTRFAQWLQTQGANASVAKKTANVTS